MSVCLARGPNPAVFVKKKFFFWFTFLSKILVARLAAITAVDRFSSDYGPQTKQAKKRCRPYFKIARNCCRTRSKNQFLYVNFSARHFWLMPPHFVYSGDGTGYAMHAC